MKLLILNIYQKKSNYYAKSLKPTALNLFSTNIVFPNIEIKFYYKILLYCIDFVIKIDKDFYYMLVWLDKIIDTKNLLKPCDRLI